MFYFSISKFTVVVNIFIEHALILFYLFETLEEFKESKLFYKY